MEPEKRVDESWKESVAKEKEKAPEAEAKSPEQNAGPAAASAGQPEAAVTDSLAGMEVNFVNYAMGMVVQAMVFLGEIPNPATDQIEKDLSHAKFIVDTLLLLREKTKGNLTKEEDDFLNQALYELQMKYVNCVNAGKKA